MNMERIGLSNPRLQLAALEVEMTNQLQELDKNSREAARQRKIAHFEDAEAALRDKADALMTNAVIGGGMKAGAGLATFCAGQNQLKADQIGDSTARGVSNGAEQSAPPQPGAPAGSQAEPPPGAPTGTQAEPTPGISPEKARLLRTANAQKGIAAGFEVGAHVSEGWSASVSTGFDRADGKNRRLAEQEQSMLDDKSDAIRRREDQFAQKLSLIEQMLQSDQETARVIVRG